jgi:hypothetical protein
MRCANVPKVAALQNRPRDVSGRNNLPCACAAGGRTKDLFEGPALLRVLASAAKHIARNWHVGPLRGCEAMPQAEPFQAGKHLLNEEGNFL